MITGKRILVISPQAWGKMFVAKHHYAVELARAGNEVYFLNPPVFQKSGSITVEPVERYEGLFIVNHQVSIPQFLRFKARKLYDILMKMHVKKLLRTLNKAFDIVWCFDANLYTNLEWFKAPVKIFHPVDELFYNYQLQPARHADVIISVTKEILKKFEPFDARKELINHGISREFKALSKNIHWQKRPKVSVGYSGNLLRTDIDFPILMRSIKQLPDINFIFWGNYIMKESNLAGGENEEVSGFIEFLKNAPNVSLRGQVTVDKLAAEYDEADLFVICYDINKDQSKGTNYHKVIEFLSTGRTVVSNNVTAYDGLNLLQMCKSRTSNEEFPALLEHTIRNIEFFNSAGQQEYRKDFAMQNSYDQHLERISQLIA